MFPSLLVALVATIPLAQAAPTLNYPLMGQEPPVARVGKPFVFDLLPGTFTSPYNITYTSSALPGWLSFASGVETFHGTPALSDVGSEQIIVTATDSTGSTTSNWTVIVSNYSVPAVHASFTTQIGNPPLREFSSATTLPGNSGVSIPPYWSFSLGFASDTFRVSRVGEINGNLFWSARERGTASLPKWLSFNNDTFTFNGNAPANGTYTIVATGSDYWGYTGAQTSFVIEVGVGEGIEWINRTNEWTDSVAMSRGEVNYKVDLSKFMMGGDDVSANELVLSLNNSDFPWLSLNPSTNTLSGIVPDHYQNGTISPYSIPLTISSTNTSNTLSLGAYLGLDIVPYLFSTFNIPNSTVNPGAAFSFNLAPYLLNTTASVATNSSNSSVMVSRAAPSGTTVSASVTPSEASKWLSFNPNTLELMGTAPSSADYGIVDVTFTALQGGYTATSDLRVLLSGMSGSGNGTAAVPDNHSGGSSGLSEKAKIGLGVGLGLLGLILLLLLLFCCCRRRRKEDKEEKDNDNDSIVASSPVQADPFRRSDPRGGRMSRFQPFAILRTPSQKHNPTSPGSLATGETVVEKPQRISQLKGILNWDNHAGHKKSPVMQTTPVMNRSNSFIAAGDVIGVSPALERPSQDASSFTQSIGSDSSRASWESRRSFQWSSAENESREGNNRLSAAPSIPRPRQNFTPRYPRNNSPSKLATLTKNDDPEASPEFSEFDSGDERSPPGSPTLGSSSSFPAGPSGLSRFGESGQFGTDEEGDGTGDEGPAVVAMAERQSFETRQPHTSTTDRPVPRLRPSKERISQIEERRRERSERALSGGEGAFDDAEELKRTSTYAPSVGGSDVQGLYPASEIFFASPQPDNRFSGMTNASTIQRVSQVSSPLSPPLPQVGSFVRPRPQSGGNRRVSGTANAEGRIIAVANETFSTHPQIHPPPTVSLSAATWSSNPPSTYRAVAENGIPPWLHFDSKALELWGVPGMAHVGEVTTIRIMEKLPQDKRRSDPSAFGYQPPQEREVGVISIEVVDRLRSPQFALDGSPHAL